MTVATALLSLYVKVAETRALVNSKSRSYAVRDTGMRSGVKPVVAPELVT